jgi:hypothetical protein
MFGQVLDKLDTFFGRAFLLARYMPWLLCAIFSLILASIEFAPVREYVRSAHADVSSKSLDLALALLTIAVIAYSTAPLVQFVTLFLEGEWMMPGWLRQLTVVTHSQRRKDLAKAWRERLAQADAAPKAKDVISALREARAAGSSHAKMGNPKAIKEADSAIATLREARDFDRLISSTDFERAQQLLARALRENCAEPSRFLDENDRTQSQRLHDLHEEMWRTITPYAAARANEAERQADRERQHLFAEHELAPTRLGNDAAALRDYCRTRYGIEFEHFWPRFLLVAQKDAKLSEAIAAAKIQLDFSVLALTLTVVSVAAWSLILLVVGRSLTNALIVLGLGPLVAYAWLGIVHASYASFAETVRSAIDLHRFEVLTALRQPLPTDLAAEHRTWDAVSRLALADEHEGGTSYRHPA